MNCEPGDLAIRVSSYPDSIIKVGSIVRLIRFDGKNRIKGKESINTALDTWIVEFKGSKTNPKTGYEWGIPDSHMRPIRDSDEEDEMLHIAGLPNKHLEAA